MNYFDFFVQATGLDSGPWPFQERFDADPATHTALIVPTGLGKTETVLTDWLYRRPTTRLGWVLPSRALTEQVARVARDLIARSRLDIQVLEMMGGREELDLMLEPSQPAILIGTLDIMVSRALNRGYARTPFRWPMDFGLLNNDIQWVFDEVQLLGEALATGAQLAAFRQRFGTFGKTPSVWISATFDPDWLKTVDFADQPVRAVRLEKDDLEKEAIRNRWNATKRLAPAPVQCRLPKGVAEFVRKEHQPGKLTLVIANTVQRAREIAEELKQLDPVLIHSRFRAADKRRQFERLLAEKGGIAVATQVIEAGMDLDADLMITDIAPWASLVQRFGRVNRKGDRAASRIFWVGRPLNTKRKAWVDAPELKPKEVEEVVRPYEVKDVDEAERLLLTLTSAAPAALPEVPSERPYKFVLRQADLLDLFDTTPDLTGNQIDVSRFVRRGDHTDVYLAWRDWKPKQNPPRSPRVSAEELCAVALYQARGFVEKHDAWVWRYAKKGAWEKIEKGDDVHPGMSLLLRSSAGGYTSDAGWLPDSKAPVPPIEILAIESTPPEASVSDELEPSPCGEEGFDDDVSSVRLLGWQTLSEHTGEVVNELNRLNTQLGSLRLEDYGALLDLAARKHDWGKAHAVFQETMRRDGTHGEEALWAKSPRKWRHRQPFFRHELASALAMLQNRDPELAAYLVAAHHGKVRMSIRSMPGEKPDNGERLARGIKDGDKLEAADLGGGVVLEPVFVSLSPSDLGTSKDGSLSWAALANRLLEKEGPFRLAFLEMLLRTADEMASSSGAVRQ